MQWIPDAKMVIVIAMGSLVWHSLLPPCRLKTNALAVDNARAQPRTPLPWRRNMGVRESSSNGVACSLCVQYLLMLVTLLTPLVSLPLGRGDDEDHIKEAISSCPVDCIYFVDRSELPLLEFIMKGCKRENVAIMGRRGSGNMVRF